MKWRYSIILVMIITLVSSSIISVPPAAAQVSSKYLQGRLTGIGVPPVSEEAEDIEMRMLSKMAATADRGALTVTTGKLKVSYVRTYGYWGYIDPTGSSTLHYWNAYTDYWAQVRGLYYLVGMPPGPWGNNILIRGGIDIEDRSKFYNVLESIKTYRGIGRPASTTNCDWEARDGMRTRAMGTETDQGVYAIARSALENTWPEGYYGGINTFEGTGTWTETPGKRYWPGQWLKDPTSGDRQPGMFASTNDSYTAVDDKYAGVRATDQLFKTYPVGLDFEMFGYSYNSPLHEDIFFSDWDLIFQKKDYVGTYDPYRLSYMYDGTIDSMYVGFIVDFMSPYRCTVSGSTRYAYPDQSDNYIYFDQANNLLLLYNRWATGFHTTSSGNRTVAMNLTVPIYGFYWPNTPAEGAEAGKITALHYLNLNEINTRVRINEQMSMVWYAMMSGEPWRIEPLQDRTNFEPWFFHPFPAAGETPNYKIDNLDSLEIYNEYDLTNRQRYDDPLLFPTNGLPQSAIDYGILVDNKPNMSILIGAGPFSMQPGDTANVSFAVFLSQDNPLPVDPMTGFPSNDPIKYKTTAPLRGAGSRFNDAYTNFDAAKEVYTNNFMGSGPPSTPTLYANGVLTLDENNYPLYLVERDRVTLYWDNAAEIIPDYGTKKLDFEGYRLWKRTYDPAGKSFQVGYVMTSWNLLGQWDLAVNPDGTPNTIKGWDDIGKDKFLKNATAANITTTVFPRELWMGNNTGLAHNYVDTGLMTGMVYEYTLTAYDRPDSSIMGVSSESLRGTSSKYRNFVKIKPVAKPQGYVQGDIQLDENSVRFNHTVGFASASIRYRIVDELLVGDSTYTISFSDSVGKKYYNVYNNTASVYAVRKGEVFDSIAVAAGTQGTQYWPIFNGIALQIRDHPGLTGTSVMQLTRGLTDTTLLNITARGQTKYWTFGSLTFQAGATPMILELRYAGHTVINDSTIVFTIADTFYDTALKTKVPSKTKFPFTVWNVTNPNSPYKLFLTKESYATIDTMWFPNRQFSIVDTNSIIKFRETISTYGVVGPNTSGVYNYRTPRVVQAVTVYDTTWYTKKDSISFYLQAGDKYFWRTTIPIASGTDEYIFTTKKHYVDPANYALWRIRAVPNPYVVASAIERYSGTSDILNREIRFVNLPGECTIDIYTIAGDHIRRLEHHSYSGGYTVRDQSRYPTGVGEARWDLLTDENLEVSYGVYIYVVKSTTGIKFIDKILIIK